MCVLWSNCVVLPLEQFDVFVNTKFICLLLLYHPCFSASQVHLTFFQSVFGASFPSRSLAMPWVARVLDPFRWCIGVSARSWSQGTQTDRGKRVKLARQALRVWHFVLTGRRRISGN
jgi:hypothetical protein